MISTTNSAVCDRCKFEIVHDYNNQHINQLEISEIPYQMIFRANLPYGKIFHLCSECLKGITSYLEGKDNDSN